MVELKKLLPCLRVTDVIDLITLIVLNSQTIHTCIHRKDYEVHNGYLVEKGLTSSSCGSDAYRFSNLNTAENAKDVDGEGNGRHQEGEQNLPAS